MTWILWRIKRTHTRCRKNETQYKQINKHINYWTKLTETQKNCSFVFIKFLMKLEMQTLNEMIYYVSQRNHRMRAYLSVSMEMYDWKLDICSELACDNSILLSNATFLEFVSWLIGWLRSMFFLSLIEIKTSIIVRDNLHRIELRIIVWLLWVCLLLRFPPLQFRIHVGIHIW